MCQNLHLTLIEIFSQKKKKKTLIEIELNAEVIVDLIAYPDYSNIAVSSIVDDCKFLVSQLF